METNPHVSDLEDPYDEYDRCRTCHKGIADCDCRAMPLGYYTRQRELLIAVLAAEGVL